MNSKLTKDMRRRYPRKKVFTVYNGWDGEQITQGISEEKYLYFAGIYLSDIALKILIRFDFLYTFHLPPK